jgi:hypothetical protein
VSGVSVVPLFATPFGVVPLPEAAALNPIVAGMLEEFSAADRQPLPVCTPLYYRSREQPDFEGDAPRALTAAMLRGIKRVVLAATAVEERAMSTWQVQSRVSFAIVRPNGSMPAQSFPMTSWCGIYVVDVPAESTERVNSGALRLYESRLGHMFNDASTSALAVPYASGHYMWQPVAGHLVVFPSSLLHGIAVIRASGQLLLAVMRVRFVAPGQGGWSTW